MFSRVTFQLVNCMASPLTVHPNLVMVDGQVIGSHIHTMRTPILSSLNRFQWHLLVHPRPPPRSVWRGGRSCGHTCFLCMVAKNWRRKERLDTHQASNKTTVRDPRGQTGHRNQCSSSTSPAIAIHRRTLPHKPRRTPDTHGAIYKRTHGLTQS